MKMYKQNIAIMANWWRHSVDASLEETVFSLLRDLRLFERRTSSEPLLSDATSSSSRRLLFVSLSLRFSLTLDDFFDSMDGRRSLDLSRTLECFRWDFFVLVCELPVE